MKKLFTLLLLIIALQKTNAQTWSPVGTGITGGRITAMCEYNGELYVGGYFNNIGGVQAFSIAKWNGTNWDSVPNAYSLTNYTSTVSISMEIDDMTVYNGELVVAGATWENGNQYRCIAKWNGTTWSQLGTGMDNRIFSIEVYNGELYATGQFEHADTLVARGIARWNGTAWNQVGGQGLNLSAGFSGSDLQVYNGELYLVGDFYLINGQPFNTIARWNGTIWNSVGTLSNSGIGRLGVYNNKLYACGNIYLPGSLANNICTWDNTTWDTLSVSLNYPPGALCNYNNEMYAVGHFDTVAGTPMKCIARWNDVQWDSCGSGLNLYHINVDTTIVLWDTTISEREIIYTLGTYNNELYAAGTFTQMGGVNANSIARWHINGASVDEQNNNQFNLSISPNPARNYFSLTSDSKLKDAHIAVYDITGRELYKRQNISGSHIEISTANFSSGIYFVKVSDGEKNVVKKLVVE